MSFHTNTENGTWKKASDNNEQPVTTASWVEKVGGQEVPIYQQTAANF